jgi:hypothetical protein
MTTFVNQAHHALVLALAHLRAGDPTVAEGIVASLTVTFPREPLLADLLALCRSRPGAGLPADVPDATSTVRSLMHRQRVYDTLQQGRGLRALGRLDHSAAFLSRAKILDPGNDAAAVELAAIADLRLDRATIGEHAPIGSALIRADLANLFLLFASEHAASGAADIAAACLREVLRLDPGHVFARDALRRCIEGIDAMRSAHEASGDAATAAELAQRLSRLTASVVPLAPPEAERTSSTARTASLPTEAGPIEIRRTGDLLSLTPSSRSTAPRVLLALDPMPVLLPDDDERLEGHSHHWEHREAAHLLLRLGYAVDVVPFADRPHASPAPYAAVLCLPEALDDLEPLLAPSARRLLQLTGSCPDYQNRREQAWAAEFMQRTGRPYAPKRQIPFAERAVSALHRADGLAFMGNDWTRDTYPIAIRDRLFPIGVTGSIIAGSKDDADYVPAQRHFLWYFGFGAVHKGLDRVLEVFRRHPHLTLHIVGQPHFEPDFEAAYAELLYRSPNITLHGYLRGRSRRLIEVARHCFCLIAPSCSEATSTAVVTALGLGLYPVVSRDCGLTLPKDVGRYLETCSVEEIEAAVLDLSAAPADRLHREIAATRSYVHETFSRQAWSRSMRAFLDRHLGTV